MILCLSSNERKHIISITDLNPRVDTLEMSVASQEVDLGILNETVISQGLTISDLQDTSNALTDAIVNLGIDLSNLITQLNGKIIFKTLHSSCAL